MRGVGRGQSTAGSGLTALPSPSPRRFLLLFALAWSGGNVAYAPLLTLLLPERVSALVGAADVWWLSVIGGAGALAASGGNLAFGWLSDRWGGRRVWSASGLAATLALLLPIARAADGPALLLAVVAWQLGLNMLLAPLAAWAADRVPDAQRGLLGGVFALAPTVGAGVGMIVVLPGLGGFGARLLIVAGIALALCAPLLLFGRSRRVASATAMRAPERTRRDLAIVWGARLTVQTAQGSLFAFLYYILRSLPGSVSLTEVSGLFTLVLLLSVPVTLGLAALADSGARRGFMLSATCIAMPVGLCALAVAPDRATAFVAYGVFGLAAASFLALQSGYAMLLLPSPGRYGRDLGLLNLANTLPNLAAPVLALMLVDGGDFHRLLFACAALTMLAAALVAAIRWNAIEPASA